MGSSWKDVAYDGLGQIMTGWVDSDGTVSIGIDVVPPHREDSPNTGLLYGRFEGWGTSGSALSQDHKKTAGLYWQDGLAVAVGGRASSASTGSAVTGGLRVRSSFAAGSKWDLISTTLARSTREVSSFKPRQAGRVIAVSTAASPKVVWVSCQSAASSNHYVIARSTDGGASFSVWHDADRNYSGLYWSPDDPTALYAVANDYGSASGGVFRFANATTGAAAPTQLDGPATNNGTDWNDLFVCKVGSVMHLFAARGNQSQIGANQAAGIWHYRNDTGAWRNLTPTGYMVVTTSTGTGTGGQSNDGSTNFKSITGEVVSGKVNVMAQVWRTSYSEAGWGRYSLSDGVTTAPYCATHLRLLDAVAHGTVTADWDVVSTNDNAGNLTAPATIWGTGPWGGAGEEWIQDRIGEAIGEKSRLGGSNYRGAQLMMSPTGGFLMSFDKAGAYRCDNPWAASAAAVKWQPFVRGLSAIDSLGVICDPDHPKRWALADIDRSYACWDDAGDGQPNSLGPDPLQSSPKGYNLIRTTVDNHALVCAETHRVYELQNWWLASASTVYNWQPGFTTTTKPQGCLGACKFVNAAGQTIRLAVGGEEANGQVKRAVGDTALGSTSSWSTSTGLGALAMNANEPCYFAWKDGTDYVALLVPGSGVYRSSNSGQSWTQVLAYSTTTNWFGHLSQSADRNTIYYTLGDGPYLFRWVNWQTTTIPGTGSGNAWKSFTGGGFAGPVCALSNGDIAVIRIYKDGTLGDVHYYTSATTTWAGIEGQRFQGYVILPHGIAGGVDIDGTYLYVVGDATAGFRYTPDPTSGTSYSGQGSVSASATFGATARFGQRGLGVIPAALSSIAGAAKVGWRALAAVALSGGLGGDGQIGATTWSGAAAVVATSTLLATPAAVTSVYSDPQPSAPIEYGYDPSVWPPAPILSGGRRHRRRF